MNKPKKTLVKKDTMGFKDPFRSKLANKKNKKELPTDENIIKEEAETEREIVNTSKFFGSIEENESQELSLVSSEKEEENILNESSGIENQISSMMVKNKEDTKKKLSISSEKNIIISTVVLPKITNKKINNLEDVRKAENLKNATISSSSSKNHKNNMFIRKPTISYLSSNSPSANIKTYASPKYMNLSTKTPIKKFETLTNKETDDLEPQAQAQAQVHTSIPPVIEVLPVQSQSQSQSKTPKNLFKNLLSKKSTNLPSSEINSERRKTITFGFGKVLANAFSPLKKQTISSNDKNILGISKLTLDLLNLRDVLLKAYYATELRNHLISKIPIENINNRHNAQIYCKICENLPYLPLECMNCEFIYCLECVKENQKCLTRNCDLNPRKVSKSMINIYQNLEIKCKNNNCNENITLKSYFQHESICNFRLVKCTIFQCPANIQYQYLEKHLSEECLFNLIICRYCSVKYPSKQISQHLENCLDKLVKCDGCEKMVRLEILNSHKLECIFLTFKCNMCLQDFYNNEKQSHNCYNEKVEELVSFHKRHSSLFEDKIKSEHLLKQENINLNRKISLLESSLRKEEIINNLLKEDNQLNLIRNIQLEQENNNLANELLIKNEQMIIINNKLNQYEKEIQNLSNVIIAKENTIQDQLKEIDYLKLEIETFKNERYFKETNDLYLTNEINKISKIYSNNQVNYDNLTKEINFYKNLYKCVGCGVIANINNLEIFKNLSFNKTEDFNQKIKSLILLSNCNHCDYKICNFCVTNCSLCKNAFCTNTKFIICNECQEGNICNDCSMSCSYCSISKCSKCYINEGFFDKTTYKCNYCSIYLSNKNKSSLISLLNDENCKTLQTETCISSFILASRGYLKGEIKYIVSFKNKFCRLNDFGVLLLDNLNLVNFDLKNKELPNFNTCFIKKNSQNIISFQKLYNNHIQSSANKTNFSFDQGISCTIDLNMDKSKIKFSINDIVLEENCSKDKVFIPFFSLCNNELSLTNHIEK